MTVTKSIAWWRHEMETFSASLALCAGNSPVPGEFPAQRPVTRSFNIFFDLCPNKRLSKQWWGWWFKTLSCPLWRHCNGLEWCMSRWPVIGPRNGDNSLWYWSYWKFTEPLDQDDIHLFWLLEIWCTLIADLYWFSCVFLSNCYQTRIPDH